MTLKKLKQNFDLCIPKYRIDCMFVIWHGEVINFLKLFPIKRFKKKKLETQPKYLYKLKEKRVFEKLIFQRNKCRSTTAPRTSAAALTLRLLTPCPHTLLSHPALTPCPNTLLSHPALTPCPRCGAS